MDDTSKKILIAIFFGFIVAGLSFLVFLHDDPEAVFDMNKTSWQKSGLGPEDVNAAVRESCNKDLLIKTYSYAYSFFKPGKITLEKVDNEKFNIKYLSKQDGAASYYKFIGKYKDEVYLSAFFLISIIVSLFSILKWNLAEKEIEWSGSTKIEIFNLIINLWKFLLSFILILFLMWLRTVYISSFFDVYVKFIEYINGYFALICVMLLVNSVLSVHFTLLSKVVEYREFWFGNEVDKSLVRLILAVLFVSFVVWFYTDQNDKSPLRLATISFFSIGLWVVLYILKNSWETSREFFKKGPIVPKDPVVNLDSLWARVFKSASVHTIECLLWFKAIIIHIRFCFPKVFLIENERKRKVLTNKSFTVFCNSSVFILFFSVVICLACLRAYIGSDFNSLTFFEIYNGSRLMVGFFSIVLLLIGSHLVLICKSKLYLNLILQFLNVLKFFTKLLALLLSVLIIYCLKNEINKLGGDTFCIVSKFFYIIFSLVVLFVFAFITKWSKKNLVKRNVIIPEYLNWFGKKSHEAADSFFLMHFYKGLVCSIKRKSESFRRICYRCYFVFLVIIFLLVIVCIGYVVFRYCQNAQGVQAELFIVFLLNLSLICLWFKFDFSFNYLISLFLLSLSFVSYPIYMKPLFKNLVETSNVQRVATLKASDFEFGQYCLSPVQVAKVYNQIAILKNSVLKRPRRLTIFGSTDPIYVKPSSRNISYTRYSNSNHHYIDYYVQNCSCINQSESSKVTYNSNIELGYLRAVAVYDLLTRNQTLIDGIDEIHVASYGDQFFHHAPLNKVLRYRNNTDYRNRRMLKDSNDTDYSASSTDRAVIFLLETMPAVEKK